MNIVQLEYFIAASRTLNFTRAAEECFTSRQNLSRAIRDLERELGVSLFNQGKGSLALTVEGIEAAKRAQRILGEVKDFKNAFSVTEAESTTLDVLVGLNLMSCTSYDISTALDKFEGRVRLGEHGCKTCYDTVANGAADLAIVGCMERAFPGCEYEVVGGNRLQLLVSENSQLAEKDSLDITDLAGHRMAILPDFEFQFEPLMKVYRACGLDMGAIDVISNVGLMLRTVRRDDSVGIASISFKENTPSGTKVVPLSDPTMQINLYALYHKASEKSAAIANLVSLIASTIRGDVGQCVS